MCVVISIGMILFRSVLNAVVRYCTFHLFLLQIIRLSNTTTVKQLERLQLLVVCLATMQFLKQ